MDLILRNLADQTATVFIYLSNLRLIQIYCNTRNAKPEGHVLDVKLMSNSGKSVDFNFQEFIAFAKQPIVRILVGPDRVAYQIHKELASQQSPYISCILKESWSTDTSEVHLDEFSAADFDVIVYWMYKRELPKQLKHVSFEGQSLKDIGKKRILDTACRLADIYKVADILMMHELQNRIADEEFIWMRNFNIFWNWEELLQLLERELSHTCFWRLAAKSFIQNSHEKVAVEAGMDAIDKKLVDYPDVARDLLVELLRYHRKEWQYLSDFSRCDFHVHPDGKKCENQEADAT